MIERVNIPVEEAIFYLEDVLRDSSNLFSCVSCQAPLYYTWARKVNNILTVVYGADSEQNVSFCSADFGSDREGLLRSLTFSVSLIRDCVRKLKRMIAVNEFSRDCFVAMWFHDSMEEIYQGGIYKPLKDMGFNPIRIDKVEHNERIDSKIFDLIRRSRFVVADFTGHRAGVYYEAGFASGLGLPVIHTCRKDYFDARHFDVHTINTIVYSGVESLSVDLRKRVEGTIEA